MALNMLNVGLNITQVFAASLTAEQETAPSLIEPFLEVPPPPEAPAGSVSGAFTIWILGVLGVVLVIGLAISVAMIKRNAKTSE